MNGVSSFGCRKKMSREMFLTGFVDIFGHHPGSNLISDKPNPWRPN